MRNYKTEGIIIKRRNIGEADRILTVFTKKNGKISIKAPGVRKIRSKRSPHIEVLNLSMLSLYKGKTLPILIEAETLETFSNIKNFLPKIAVAYHACEIVDGLCPEEEENKEVFFLLKEFLERLCFENHDLLILDFEKNLLKSLGFFPRTLDRDLNTSSFIEQILERKLKVRQIMPRLL
ncbi:MAG: DNA repair protein RecO [Patescibacteria group bacterium]|nr:DNA repair protein RecO [Patescibacteria group bacterium]